MNPTLQMSTQEEKRRLTECLQLVSWKQLKPPSGEVAQHFWGSGCFLTCPKVGFDVHFFYFQNIQTADLCDLPQVLQELEKAFQAPWFMNFPIRTTNLAWERRKLCWHHVGITASRQSQGRSVWVSLDFRNASGLRAETVLLGPRAGAGTFAPCCLSLRNPFWGSICIWVGKFAQSCMHGAGLPSCIPATVFTSP